MDCSVPRRKKAVAMCNGCGKQFHPRDARYSTYCSRECAFAHKAGEQHHHFRPDKKAKFSRVYIKHCEKCAGLFVARQSTTKYCSDPCRKLIACQKDRARQQENDFRDRTERRCKGCGKVFIPGVYGDKRRLLCSEKCARHYFRRISKARRRAVERGRDADRVDPIQVFDRDGWRCQICGKPTPKSKRGSFKPRAPELDHRIPLAMGGSHTYANVQCACRECNQSKGGKMVIGQLPMFIR